MRIFQVLPTIAYGDAVGNDTMALLKILYLEGYETSVYAENIDQRIKDSRVKHYSMLPELSDQDVIIYHLSTGTELNQQIAFLKARKVIIYHNITPPEFFSGYSETSFNLCKSGLEGATYLADKADYCLADSSFNKSDLIKMGFKCKIDVLPVLVPFDDYLQEPDRKTVSLYRDDYTNILFTGRIAPNKCQQDVIKAFYFYQKYYNKKSRLFLVGSYGGMESYYSKLLRYTKTLGLRNVFFSGHISFRQVLSYYSIADLFLCMSEHEGFCVPLLEAMQFHVPILAYNSSAIGETLSNGGFQLQEKKPLETAAVMNRILQDKNLRDEILINQEMRKKDFSYEIVSKKFLDLLKGFLNEN